MTKCKTVQVHDIMLQIEASHYLRATLTNDADIAAANALLALQYMNKDNLWMTIQTPVIFVLIVILFCIQQRATFAIMGDQLRKWANSC